MQKSRGRPRQFDEVTVLLAAENVFWQKGYDDTSLDDLANAMGMNRPSIYRAFGDKESLYLTVLTKYCEKMESAFEQTMSTEKNLDKRLVDFLTAALKVYTEGDQPKGCMAMGTAITAATGHREIQEVLLNVIHGLEEKLIQKFDEAIVSGYLPAGKNALDCSVMAQALLHSLSLRSRAGDPHVRLLKMIKGGVQMITG
jgi:AcrR family transcriptional regulator